MPAALIKPGTFLPGLPKGLPISPSMEAPARLSQHGYPAHARKVTESPSSTTGYFSPRPHDDELLSLHQEITGFDDAIRQLNQERALRCRRLNEIQSSISILPSSILQTIFEYVCPPSEYNSSHQRVRRSNAKPLVLPIFALCGVSSRWRQIILSTPQFWRKLDWFWKYHLPSESTSALLRAYFTRAASCPFDLKLTIVEKWEIEDIMPFSDPDHIEGHLDTLKRTIFFDNARKIGSLKLDAPTRWLHLVSKSFTSLTDLSLCSGRIDECIDLSSLPHLARVTFVNVKVTPNLPWRQITHAHLIRPHINVSLELLTRCLNLVEFHSQHPNPVKRDSISHLARPITLHRLEWLDWFCIGSLWDDALFKYTHLPSLRKLSLTGDIPWSSDVEHTLTTFLVRLPSPVIDLELGFVQDFVRAPSSPFVKTLFRALPTIQHLTLLEDDHKFLERVLRTLIPPSSSLASSPSTSLPSSPPSHSSPPSPTSPSFLSSLPSFLSSSSPPHREGEGEGEIYLPSLRTLSLKTPSRDYAKDSNDVFTHLRGAPQQLPALMRGDIFVELIKQRHKILAHVPVFRLELDFEPAWRVKGKEELMELASGATGRSGEGGNGEMKLEVFERGVRVGWLPIIP